VIAIGAIERETEFLEFIVAGQRPRTFIWEVRSRSGNCLGTVAWYSAWRQYVFYPDPETLYNHQCLDEIRRFVVDMTDLQKRRREALVP
jgi:hypothetical protein